MDAQEELNKSVQDEMLDMVVLAVAKTLTPRTATHSGKKLEKDLWMGYADGAGDKSIITGSKGQSPGQADMGWGKGRVFSKMIGGRGFLPRVNSGGLGGTLSFLKCLMAVRSVIRKLPPRETAIIREANETDFVLNLLETGGTAGSESREKNRCLNIVRCVGTTCTSLSP